MQLLPYRIRESEANQLKIGADTNYRCVNCLVLLISAFVNTTLAQEWEQLHVNCSKAEDLRDWNEIKIRPIQHAGRRISENSFSRVVSCRVSCLNLCVHPYVTYSYLHVAWITNTKPNYSFTGTSSGLKSLFIAVEFVQIQIAEDAKLDTPASFVWLEKGFKVLSWFQEI